jgi:hypothetical protein
MEFPKGALMMAPGTSLRLFGALFDFFLLLINMAVKHNVSDFKFRKEMPCMQG